MSVGYISLITDIRTGSMPVDLAMMIPTSETSGTQPNFSISLSGSLIKTYDPMVIMAMVVKIWLDTNSVFVF